MFENGKDHGYRSRDRFFFILDLGLGFFAPASVLVLNYRGLGLL